MFRKEYAKNRKTCEVTFVHNSPAASAARRVNLVGDFNNWNKEATPLEREPSGSWAGRVKLEAGREYQFRYLLDGEQWENDWNADKYVPTPFAETENSVVIV